MESVCGELRSADMVTGGQVRGLAPSQKKSYLSVCIRCDRDRSGTSQARKTGWTQAALSTVPW